MEWGTQVRDQWPSGHMELTVPTSYVGAYPQFINPNPPVLDDVQMRRALLHAANRQQLIDSLLDGLAPIAHVLINPYQAEWKEVEPSIVKYEYDPRQATQLIEGLGYNRANDGIFRDGSGQRLSFELRSTSTDDYQMKTMFSLADYWQQVGVATDQVAVPQQRESDREYRATRPAFEVVRQPGGWQNLERFYGPNTPLPENNYTGIDRPATKTRPWIA